MSELLPAIEIETKPKPSHAVIWLHGLGADGNDFVPVVKEMKLPPLGIRFVFPHAPMRPVTINGGFVMRAWYDIAYQEFASKEDERGLRESQKLIEDLIARENARGIPSSRIVLAGFSQGGVMTLQVGLRQPKRLAGLMALSAYLPMSPMIEVERNAASNSVP
ncbi:MAG: carboxylesterase, partial [Pseudomonadota bacterium]